MLIKKFLVFKCFIYINIFLDLSHHFRLAYSAQPIHLDPLQQEQQMTENHLNPLSTSLLIPSNEFSSSSNILNFPDSLLQVQVNNNQNSPKNSEIYSKSAFSTNPSLNGNSSLFLQNIEQKTFTLPTLMDVSTSKISLHTLSKIFNI